MREREVIRERPVDADREIIVDERPPARGGGGGVVAAVIGILLVLIIGWFLLNALGIMGEAADNATDNGAEIEAPDMEGSVEVEGEG